MKNKKYKFFIFIASITIGFLISINFRLNRGTKIFSLSTKEYSDASEERNKLYNEISDLKEDNYYLKKKINGYYNDDNNSEKIIEDMKLQLKEYSELLGTTSIKGPGIVVRVTDGIYSLTENSQYEINRRTLHDSDVAMIFNEFRNLGAEAIALNDYRVLGTTGVTCAWAFVEFDDKKVEASPFYFYAIGNPEQLEAGILSEGSHINTLIIRELNVEIERIDEIILTKTSKTLSPQYMERGD